MEQLFTNSAYIGLRLGKETKVEFKKLANKQGKSLSFAVREMMEKKVAAAKKRGAL